MSDDPRLEEIRDWYIAGRRTHNPFASDAELVRRFDLWLVEHDDEVRDAAKADSPDEETVRDELAGWPIGSGYYQTTVGTDEAREMARAVLALLRGEQTP